MVDAAPPAPPAQQQKMTFLDFLKTIPFGVSAGPAGNQPRATAMSWNDLERGARAGWEQRRMFESYDKVGEMLGYGEEMKSLPTLGAKRFVLENIQYLPLGTKRAERLFGRPTADFYPSLPQDVAPPGMQGPPAVVSKVPEELRQFADLAAQLPLRDFVTLLQRKDGPFAGVMGGAAGGGADMSGQKAYYLNFMQKGSPAYNYLQGVPTNIDWKEFRQSLQYAEGMMREEEKTLFAERKRVSEFLRDKATSLGAARQAQLMQQAAGATSLEQLQQLERMALQRPLLAPEEAMKQMADTGKTLNDILNRRTQNQPIENMLLLTMPAVQKDPNLLKQLTQQGTLVSPEAQDLAIQAITDHALTSILPSMPAAQRQAAYANLDSLLSGLSKGKNRLPPFETSGLAEGAGQAQAAQQTPTGRLQGKPEAYLRLPAALRQTIDVTIARAAAQYGLDPAELYGVMAAESNFDPMAQSHVGAIGLMQLMPGTARDMQVDPWSIEGNIMGGAKYYALQKRTFGGNRRLALAAYNAGPGAVTKYGGVPPFRETQEFIARVERLTRRFGGRGGATTASAGAAPPAPPAPLRTDSTGQPAPPGPVTEADERTEDSLADAAMKQQAVTGQPLTLAQKEELAQWNRATPGTGAEAPQTPPAAAGTTRPAQAATRKPAPAPPEPPVPSKPLLEKGKIDLGSGIRHKAGLRRLQVLARRARQTEMSPAAIQAAVQRLFGQEVDVSALTTPDALDTLVERLGGGAAESPPEATVPAGPTLVPGAESTAGRAPGQVSHEMQNWVRAVKRAVANGTVPAERAVQAISKRLKVTPEVAQQYLQ